MPGDGRADGLLFGEGQSRIVISLPEEDHLSEARAIAAADHGCRGRLSDASQGDALVLGDKVSCHWHLRVRRGRMEWRRHWLRKGRQHADSEGGSARHGTNTGYRRHDSPREACGVFGIYGRELDVAKLTYFGLHALQHRGQESAGIASADGKQMQVYRSMGLVSHVFSEEILEDLQGIWQSDIRGTPPKARAEKTTPSPSS